MITTALNRVDLSVSLFHKELMNIRIRQMLDVRHLSPLWIFIYVTTYVFEDASNLVFEILHDN
jgi:hypothetical protein